MIVGSNRSDIGFDGEEEKNVYNNKNAISLGKDVGCDILLYDDSALPLEGVIFRNEINERWNLQNRYIKTHVIKSNISIKLNTNCTLCLKYLCDGENIRYIHGPTPNGDYAEIYRDYDRNMIFINEFFANGKWVQETLGYIKE